MLAPFCSAGTRETSEHASARRAYIFLPIRMDEKLGESVRWVCIACIYTTKSLCGSSPHESLWLGLTFARTSETHEMQSQIALSVKPPGVFVL